MGGKAPTKILFGTGVPNFGACDTGVPEGVIEGEMSVDEV